MRYSILALAPFVAAAYGQETESTTPLPVASSSTYTYSNTMTNFLTLTNSYGVVTGMPTLSNPGTPVVVTSQPAVVTSQPAAESIPAGLTGVHTIYRGGSNTSTSYFVVSAGPSTTVILSSSTSTASGSDATGASGSAGQGASGTQSAGASESSSAADAVKVVSGAVLGLGAVFVALL